MPRVVLGAIKGLKPGSAITKVVRDAADRLYDAFLRDPNPGKCACSVCRVEPNPLHATSKVRLGSFDLAYSEFVRATAKEFEKMAVKIYRRFRGKWSLPDAVEERDVEQDLHVEIVRILRKYKPEKATVAAFLVWNAFARAKKECNKQRGKVKDKEPSLHAFVVSGLLSAGESGPERFEDCIDRLALESESIDLDRECESMLDSKKMLRRVRKHLSEQDSRYIRRIVKNGGNVRQTAFSMISALDELDEARREIVVKRKTKKLMVALKNAANVWQQLQKQEQEHGSGKGKQEKRIEEERQIGDSGLRKIVGGSGVATARSRRSASSPHDARKAQTRHQRKGARTNRSSLFLLCA